MKKNFYGLCIFFVFIFSCTIPISNDKNNNNSSNPAIEAKSMEYKLAELVADTRLKETALNGSCTWTNESTIGEGFPIYTPGIAGISYYEFKVKTGMENTGYILVSCTEADVQIPEVSQTGVPLTEEYQDALGQKDFDIIRYNYFESIAVKSKKPESKFSDFEILAEKYDAGINVINQIDKESKTIVYKNMNYTYAQSVVSKGCIPYLYKDGLDRYYTDIKQNASNKSLNDILLMDYNQKSSASKGDPPPPPSWWPQIVSAEYNLANDFTPDHWKLPKWTQCLKNNKPVGCSVLAWGMVYAYWRQFKGKNRLFHEQDITAMYNPWDCNERANNGLIYNALWEINGYCKTIDGGTYPINIPLGYQYGNNAGYNVWVIWVNAWFYTQIIDEINADRPVILSIAASPGWWSTINHSVVIEGVRRRYWNNTGWNVEIGYMVNFGWGGTRKEIYLFSDRIGSSDLYNMWETYFVNM